MKYASLPIKSQRFWDLPLCPTVALIEELTRSTWALHHLGAVWPFRFSNHAEPVHKILTSHLSSSKQKQTLREKYHYSLNLYFVSNRVIRLFSTTLLCNCKWFLDSTGEDSSSMKYKSPQMYVYCPLWFHQHELL